MNIIVDTKYRIDDITKAKPEKIQENVYEEINKYVLNRLPYPDITEENYNPEIVVEHLSKLRKLIEEKSKQVANIFSYYEWLYHIRRMPSVFFQGRLGTTYSYDTSLAHYVASFSTNKNSFLKPVSLPKLGIETEGNIQLALTQKKIQYILRFIFHIKFLSHIDVLIRRSSKGIKLIKKFKHECLPVEIPDKYLQESISIFDKRMASDHGDIAGLYSRMGLSPNGFIKFEEENCVIPAICGVASDGSTSQLPLNFSNKEKVNIAPSYLIYFQEYIIIQDYLQSINSEHVFDLYMINIIAIFLYLSLDFIITKELPLVSFYQVGYFLFNKPSFEKFVEEHFNEAKKTVEKIFLQELDFDFHVLLSEMRKKSASSYPFHAPGYFNLGQKDQLCIDLNTCTAMLNTYLEHKVIVGEVANKRAAQFEDSLQKLIDSTTYKPDENVRALVKQKSIDFDGKQLTDIDAAFFYKDTLILISAKSYIYNSEYDRGNYNYIRNIKSNIEGDICYWRKVIEFINKNRIGGNYNLSSYRKIQGIVCTPSLFFIGADYYKSKIDCGINEYQSVIELYNLISKV